MSEEPAFEVTVILDPTEGDSTSGDPVHVKVAGEVDVATAPELSQQLMGVLDTGRTRILVDLEEVGFLDSSGIAVLLRCTAAAKEAGGSLAVRNPSAMIRRVFDISGINEILNVEPPG